MELIWAVQTGTSITPYTWLRPEALQNAAASCPREVASSVLNQDSTASQERCGLYLVHDAVLGSTLYMWG